MNLCAISIIIYVIIILGQSRFRKTAAVHIWILRIHNKMRLYLFVIRDCTHKFVVCIGLLRLLTYKDY